MEKGEGTKLCLLSDVAGHEVANVSHADEGAGPDVVRSSVKLACALGLARNERIFVDEATWTVTSRSEPSTHSMTIKCSDAHQTTVDGFSMLGAVEAKPALLAQLVGRNVWRFILARGRKWGI